MALIWNDRVLETSTTTGTGAFTLAAAVTGYQRFSAAMSTNDTCHYSIIAVDANGNPSGDWETGLGTYSGANTLTRTTVQQSSNSDNAVNFAAGTKYVMLTPTAAFISGLGSGGGAWQLQWGPLDNEPPTTNYATLDTRNARSVLDFDTTTQEAAIFSGTLPPDYGGAGITVSIFCALTSATTGTVGWDVAIERIDASSLDIDSDSFAAAQTVTAATVPGTSGQVLKMSVNIANGADMDSLAAGELFRLRVRRDVANDTATGDAELLRVLMVEQ